MIHGQHHIETMTALLRFPNVPAIYFCHGWLPWEEIPPLFPRILQYVAVDYTVRDRLICEHAIPEDKVQVILNFVDLDRFKVREPLPASPRRALVFGNNVTSEAVGVVRETCANAGIQVDTAGMKSGSVSYEPEELLRHYDLVFAKARCALEAIAVGTSVVVCDGVRIGPLVTTENLESLRRANFGIRALRQTLSVDAVASQIARYDSFDAAEVSRRIRATASRESAVDEIVALYQKVLAEYQTPSTDPSAEGRAAANYVSWLTQWVRDERRAMKEERRKLNNSSTMHLRRRPACDACHREVSKDGGPHHHRSVSADPLLSRPVLHIS